MMRGTAPIQLMPLDILKGKELPSSGVMSLRPAIPPVVEVVVVVVVVEALDAAGF